MKKIPDEEWARLFSDENSCENRDHQERDLFLRAMKESAVPDDGDSPQPNRMTSERPERRRLLKKRVLEVDAELDLHERTREEAAYLLEAFLRQARADQCGVVRIISGKGHHSKGKGILRSYVERWIRCRSRDEIVWYAAAPRAMGGEGAWILGLVPTTGADSISSPGG